MSTNPFSSELANWLEGPTAWRFSSILEAPFTPRFFCCDSIYNMGITGGKEPVAIIDLTPESFVFVGETVNYTGTASYDPDGSVTSYAWTFEGHDPSTGTASAGTLAWGTAGLYTVQLIVTDGTGLDSAPAREEVYVVERAEITGEWLATSNGIYYSADTENWAAQNTGLSGDSLIANDIKIDPATAEIADTSKAIWIATNGGVYFNPTGGTSTWSQQNPGSVSNKWSDSPAPTVDDLHFKWLLFASNKLFAIGTWQNGSDEWRSWLFYTTDAGSMRTNPTGTAEWSEV